MIPAEMRDRLLLAHVLECGPADRLVLAGLMLHSYDETWNAYPSIETLTILTGLSRRQVRRSLRSLEEKRCIVYYGQSVLRTREYAWPTWESAREFIAGPAEANEVGDTMSPKEESSSLTRERLAG